MKASLQWLQSLVASGEVSHETVADTLARGGFEVRATVALDGDLSPVAPGPGEVDPDVDVREEVPAAFDTILDVVDTDRADLLGHVGLARELAALLALPFHPPGVDAPVRVAQGAVESRVDVDVHDPDGCLHFGLVVVEEVQVERSPLWLRVRLHALGIEPCNAVDDLASLVTLESGHPVVAYDLDRIAGPLVVRRAKQGEGFVDEAGREIALDGDDLVVADREGVIELAGVARAKRAHTDESTRRIVLASGCFDPSLVGRMEDRHGLRTEASRRHRRGVDRNDTAEVLAQAGALATRLAKGAAVAGAIHVFDSPYEAAQLVLDEKVVAGLGASLDRAKALLEHLGFEAVPLHGGVGSAGLQVSVPSFRTDVVTAEDLAREVARLHAAWEAAGIG